MPRPKTADDVLSKTAELYLNNNRSLKKAAAQSGVGYQTFVSRVRVCKERGTMPLPPLTLKMCLKKKSRPLLLKTR